MRSFDRTLIERVLGGIVDRLSMNDFDSMFATYHNKSFTMWLPTPKRLDKVVSTKNVVYTFSQIKKTKGKKSNGFNPLLKSVRRQGTKGKATQALRAKLFKVALHVCKECHYIFRYRS